MNKVIGVVVWAAMVLLCASCTGVSAQQQVVVESTEDEHALNLNALALMQTPPVERSGRNMWAGLMTLAEPNLTPEQRQTWADDYTAQFNHWYDFTYVEWYLKNGGGLRFVSEEKTSPEPVPPPLNKHKSPIIRVNPGNNALCTSKGIADCLSIVRQQPHATMQALAPYADVLEHIAELSKYDHYHIPLRQVISTPTPPLQYLILPYSASAHALTHVNDHSNQALMGLCRDANTARVLIRDGNNDLLLMMVGVSMLRNNLHVAAQIIAELPLEVSLPPSCDAAFAPLTAEDINLSLCSAMRGEFAVIHNYMELEKKSLIDHLMLPKNEHVSDWDNVLFAAARSKAAVCYPQIQATLLRDEKFVILPTAKPTWPQQCSNRILKNQDNAIAYGMACFMAQGISGPDPADYVHRMQDAAAQLQMMQVLLWLRQQPHLPQPITSDYLQTAVPANLYTSTQRPLTVSEDGNELKIPVYEKYPRDPCGCVRLPLPLALRYGEQN